MSDNVHAAALANARDYELQCGVADTRLDEAPAEHPGFDFVRRNEDGEAERIIQVEGLTGAWTTRGVSLRSVPDNAVWTLGDRYWVYVVEHAGDPVWARVHAIRNPITRTTSFQLDQGWRPFAEHNIEGPALPAIGKHLYRGIRYFGVIEAMVGDPANIDAVVVLSVRDSKGKLRDRTWSRFRHQIAEEK